MRGQSAHLTNIPFPGMLLQPIKKCPAEFRFAARSHWHVEIIRVVSAVSHQAQRTQFHTCDALGGEAERRQTHQERGRISQSEDKQLVIPRVSTPPGSEPFPSGKCGAVRKSFQQGLPFPPQILHALEAFIRIDLQALASMSPFARRPGICLGESMLKKFLKCNMLSDNAKLTTVFGSLGSR